MMVHKLALFGILSLLITAQAQAQGGVFKCTDKSGRTTYSDSPCPGAGAPAGPAGIASANPVLNPQDMTLRQANIASDCSEVLARSKQSESPDLKSEAADFNRYCASFGYRTPLGPQNQAFNERHSKELMPKLRHLFGELPSFSRSYQGGRRDPPLLADASEAMKEKLPVAAKSQMALLPDVQPGLWRHRLSRGSNIEQEENCEGPFSSLQETLMTFDSLKKYGCALNSSKTGPRKASITLDCPMDIARDGLNMKKGRIEMMIDSPNPQEVVIHLNMHSEKQIKRSTRVSACR